MTYDGKLEDDPLLKISLIIHAENPFSTILVNDV